MSELSEEEIARVVRQAMLSNPDGGPFRHRETERSLIASEAARLVLALLQPALERARREGYAIGFGASAEGYNSEYPFDGDFSGDPKWQAVRETEIAAAIRKG